MKHLLHPLGEELSATADPPRRKHPISSKECLMPQADPPVADNFQVKTSLDRLDIGSSLLDIQLLCISLA